MNIQSTTTPPGLVPVDFDAWRAYHFAGRPVPFVDFKSRKPAPNLRRLQVERLAFNSSFTNLVKKIKF